MLILHLHRPWFDAIAQGYKRFEYREATPYWTKRLEGRQYDRVLLHNGYRPSDPQLVMAYHGYEMVEDNGRTYYKLQLGPILEVRNYQLPGPESLPHAADCMDLNQCFSPRGHRRCMYRCPEHQRWMPKPLPPAISVRVEQQPLAEPTVGREVGRIALGEAPSVLNECA